MAYEIDKYAIETSSHNFPIIEHKGDVFKADFKEYEGFDFLIGGSPCTYWSIAQTKNRETVASGLGWELFSQYARALKEVKPKYFIYENNKSMSAEIRRSISETFGFEPICINSALVSAQNRQRLYWVGIRQADGTYKKCDVEQPQDKGILLKDILETNAVPYQDKAHVLTASYDGVAEPVRVGTMPTNDGRITNSQANRIYSIDGKSVTIKAEGGGWGAKTGLYADMVAEPLIVKEATQKGYTEIEGGQCVDLSMPNSKTRRGRNMADKANCLQTSNEFYEYCGTVNSPIYEVKDGMITVKGKQYPIKLVDGYYIIRKLTIKECMRLQTVPEWYEFPVSNTQAYKMLGNGWTVDVIAHLIKSIEREAHVNTERKEEALKHLQEAFKVTANGEELIDLQYDPNEEVVLANLKNKIVRINVACDSDVAMVADVTNTLYRLLA